ncbi:MAG TPA: phospholipase A2 [Acidimicrobiales bacterium]|nr:phospholipase A2 [Acidimicrobiales bacterium]
MRRLVTVVVLAAVMAAGAPAAADDEAPEIVARGVATSPAVLAEDGGACTAVPDQLAGIFDFTDACVRHDICYALGADRLACDLAFRQDMVELCHVQHPHPLDLGRVVCLTFAELYFLGVRLFGGLAFQELRLGAHGSPDGPG